MKIDPSKARRNLTALMLVAIVAFAVASPALTQTLPVPVAQQDIAAEPELVAEVMKATGHAADAIQVTAGPYQLVVTLLNSKLVSPSAREAEAMKIAAAISQAITVNPRFKMVQAFHIDYVAVTADHAGAHIVDAIDFRKDPKGSFIHHKS